MMQLTLIGIGTGNPQHLTLQAIAALNEQDIILIPRKGEGKADLAELRHEICRDVLTNPETSLVEFDLPVRDETTSDYYKRVEDWHDAIAQVWAQTLATAPKAQKAGLLVWGDPSLYDSTLRIAARLQPAPQIRVVPGMTSLQVLTAAHAIPINEVGAPFMVTTGRQLRDQGWPVGVKTIAVMLDGSCTFQTLDTKRYHIWWGGFVGMPQQILCAGLLADVSEKIVEMRKQARADHGWIMDIYVLRQID